MAFKANTDDMRDAPAIDIINLQNDGAKISAFDPKAMERGRGAKNIDYKKMLTKLQDVRLNYRSDRME